MGNVEKVAKAIEGNKELNLYLRNVLGMLGAKRINGGDLLEFNLKGGFDISLSEKYIFLVIPQGTDILCRVRMDGEDYKSLRNALKEVGIKKGYKYSDEVGNLMVIIYNCLDGRIKNKLLRVKEI